ncbi:MAG: hypothetical protein WC516_06765 [Patescibacteria group bacterium]|jgi:hypothetical protein
MGIDLIGLLDEFGVEWIDEGANTQAGWINVNCPVCEDDDFHMGWNLDGDYFHCWRCGGHRNEYVLQRLLHVSYSEVQKKLNEFSDRSFLLHDLNKKKVGNVKKIELPGSERLGELCREYLEKRRFDPDYIQDKYLIRDGGISGDYCFRLIIPIIYKGQVVTFTSRDVTDEQEIRYKQQPLEEAVMNPKHVLYNLDNIDDNEGWVCVVEGPVDVWRMGSNFICPFGTAYTDKQILVIVQLLSKRISRSFCIFIMFDSEKQAQIIARQIGSELNVLGFTNVYQINLESKKDPAQLSDKKAQKIRKQFMEIVRNK